MEENTNDGFSCLKISITNELGLHARAAAKLVKVANEFDSDIYIVKDGCSVSGKSIIGLLTLAAECGAEIELKAKGDDAYRALEQIVLLVEDKFGEGR